MKTYEVSADDKKEDLKKAKNVVFRLFKVRHQSEKEVRDKLQKKKFDDATINQAVQYFKGLEFIDDRSFTQKWITYRLARSLGKNRIRFELKNKGVSPIIIEEELKSATENYSEMETVSQLAEKQIEKYGDIEKEKIKQRLYGYLARRGFSLDIINRVVRNYDR